MSEKELISTGTKKMTPLDLAARFLIDMSSREIEELIQYCHFVRDVKEKEAKRKDLAEGLGDSD